MHMKKFFKTSVVFFKILVEQLIYLFTYLFISKCFKLWNKSLTWASWTAIKIYFNISTYQNCRFFDVFIYNHPYACGRYILWVHSWQLWAHWGFMSTVSNVIALTFLSSADPCTNHRSLWHTIWGWLLPLPVPLPPWLPHPPPTCQTDHHWAQHGAFQPQLLPQWQSLPEHSRVSVYAPPHSAIFRWC